MCVCGTHIFSDSKKVKLVKVSFSSLALLLFLSSLTHLSLSLSAVSLLLNTNDPVGVREHHTHRKRVSECANKAELSGPSLERLEH